MVDSGVVVGVSVGSVTGVQSMAVVAGACPAFETVTSEPPERPSSAWGVARIAHATLASLIAILLAVKARPPRSASGTSQPHCRDRTKALAKASGAVRPPAAKACAATPVEFELAPSPEEFWNDPSAAWIAWRWSSARSAAAESPAARKAWAAKAVASTSLTQGAASRSLLTPPSAHCCALR